MVVKRPFKDSPWYLPLLPFPLRTVHLSSSCDSHAGLGRIEELLDSIGTGTKIQDTAAAELVQWTFRRLIALTDRCRRIYRNPGVSSVFFPAPIQGAKKLGLGRFSYL